MSTTAGIDTPQQAGELLQIPAVSGVTMYAGNLVAIDATGKALLASDTAGLKAVGRLEQDVINASDYTGHAYASVRRGCFSFANSAAHPLAQANLGATAYVEDEQTVAASSAHSFKAGTFIGFDVNGNPVIDTRNAIAG